MSLLHVAKIAVFAPLLGFLMAGIGSLKPRNVLSEGLQFSDRFAQIVTCSLMGICVLASCLLFYQVALGHQEASVSVIPWIVVGQFTVHWGMMLDALSVTMMMVVSLVSLLVHIYSVGYMSHDHSIPRFMAYLSFFTFAMLVLVTAPNLGQLFFGLESLGVSS